MKTLLSSIAVVLLSLAEASGAGRLVLHLDFNTIQMTKASVLSSLRTAAAAGYDTVLWEIENKVKWECCPECVHPEAFTKDEFRELLAEADRLGLKAIPLLQTFGHAEYVLMDGGHSAWMEDPSFPACYCVSNPEVRRFLKSLLHEYLELFGPHVKDFHLGGDEAMAFGRCPACKARGRMDLYVEHLEAVAEELRTKGIRPGVWHDMVLWSETDAERLKLPKDYVIWYWNYRYDGKDGGACAGDLAKLGKGGWPIVLSAATASWGDSPFLPRYGAHSRNLAACAELARARNLMGLCVTSWSIRQLSKDLQVPLWEYAAKRYRAPSASAEADLADACAKSFGDLASEKLERLTEWDSRISSFDGTSWFPFIKCARPAPAGTLEKTVKGLRKDATLRKRMAELAAGLRETLASVRSASATPRARTLADGAELMLAFLDGVDAAFEAKTPASLPKERTVRYFESWQTPLSASNSCAVTWSVVGGKRVEGFDVADRAVTGDVTVVNVPWTFKDGRIDWLFNPTKSWGPAYNPEWTWQLNRMYFWSDYVRAYEATKDEKYVRAFVRQLADWLDQTGGVLPEQGYNDCGSAWRTIEEGLRLMGSWHRAWQAFRASPLFTPELQKRFRTAAREQARHLLRHHSKGGNWLLMEMNGVYAFATDFPDEPESAAMRKESAARLSEAIRQQILPDGLQYELSPDYHSVSISCAQQMYETAVRTGFASELPADFAPLLERMADAVLALATPSLVQPRFNDCFTMHGDRMVGGLAPLFPKRQDLAWLASRRASGREPAGATASRFLPWSGFAVMRSDWGADATYLAFDVGPLGRAHIHQDKLSFTLWKGGEELVFDDGGGQYDNSPERVYAMTGHDHNTLVVDGLAQQRSEPRCVTEPIDADWQTSPERDRAVGVYDQGFGPNELKLARHRREIVFDRKADAFTVTDDVTSADGKEHDYAILFQLDTTNTVVSADGKRLVARYGRTWDLSLEVREGGLIETVSGRPAPQLAGWYIGRNDQSNHVATTVFVRAPKGRERRFATVLKPVKAER